MPRITFVGTGEAFDPALPNTSVLFEGARTLLVDCGYSVPQAFWRLSQDPSLLDGIYLTHSHADHSFGLPGLLVWMRFAGRQRPLRLLGGPGSGAWIREILEQGYPGAYDPSKCFALEWVEVPTDRDLVWDGLRLRAAASRHSLPNHALWVEESGVVYCHSGDGAPTPETRALFRGADLLVHECYRARGVHEHHSSASDLLAMVEEQGISTLCLVHIEAGERARSDVLEAVREHGAPPGVLLPAPGDKIDLARSASCES